MQRDSNEDALNHCIPPIAFYLDLSITRCPSPGSEPRDESPYVLVPTGHLRIFRRQDYSLSVGGYEYKFDPGDSPENMLTFWDRKPDVRIRAKPKLGGAEFHCDLLSYTPEGSPEMFYGVGATAMEAYENAKNEELDGYNLIVNLKRLRPRNRRFIY